MVIYSQIFPLITKLIMQIKKTNLTKNQQNHYTRIQLICSIIIEKGLPTIRTFLRRADACQKLGEYAQAIDDYTLSLTNAQSKFPILLKRASCYQLLGEIDLCIRDYDTYLKRFPADLSVVDLRANALFSNKDYELAAEDFSLLLHASPSSLLFYSRGRCHSELFLFQKAIDDFSCALSQTPEKSIIFYHRSKCYGELGLSYHALSDISKSLIANPSRLKFRIERTHILYELQQYDLAIDDCNYIQQLLGSEGRIPTSDFFIFRSNCYKNLGRHKKAVADECTYVTLKAAEVDNERDSQKTC